MEVKVPAQNGKPKGYALVTPSWTKAANVIPSDICKAYSGMIDVNSRSNILASYAMKIDHASTKRMPDI